MTGKKALVVGGLGLGGLLGYLLLRKPKLPPGEGAEITIEILGPDGVPIKSSSPVTLLEGESYTVRITVTNTSTKVGEPWEATFEVVVYADGAVVYFFPTVSRAEYFAAGQTRSFNYPLNVPLGTGGQSGRVWALIEDPAGIELARTSEYITVESVEIIYGATIVIGV